MIKLKNLIAVAKDADYVEVFYKNGDKVEAIDQAANIDTIMEDWLSTLPLTEIESLHVVSGEEYDDLFAGKTGDYEPFDRNFLKSDKVLVMFLYPVEFWNN